MNIEEEIFKRSHVILEKLEPYGFSKINDKYIYTRHFFNNTFKAEITIDKNRILTGKVIDLEFNEEYTNIRVINQTGKFVNKIRNLYKDILINIKENCFEEDFFISKQANMLTKYINDTYQDKPEFLWNKFKGYGVFRNKEKQKWYGIIMNIDKSKLDNHTEGEIEILNIKLNQDKIIELLNQKGFYKAYHMNSKDWISIILDGTIPDKKIISLLNESYNLINKKEEWLIPANPKYYDIANCFKNNNIIIWKQSSNIHVGDIIYMYVAEPYSRIMYKCAVTETDIPYNYKDNNLTIKRVMKIKLIKEYNKDYTFKFLNKLGIKSIRGPRKITESISNHLK